MGLVHVLFFLCLFFFHVLFYSIFYVAVFSFQMISWSHLDLGLLLCFLGAKRADIQLGVPWEVAKIRWIGVPGMLWSRVLPKDHRYARLDRAPDVLVLHVRGNDFEVWSMRHLVWDTKFDVLHTRMDFPLTLIVWPDIIAILPCVGLGQWRRLTRPVLRLTSRC